MGQTILLVDDEAELLDVLAEQLSSRFSEVIPHSSGAKALDELKTRDIDMIVTDFRMPGLNGLALLAEARKLKPWMPVLILTGNDHEPDLLKALPTGGFDFQEKPFRFEVLVNRIQNGLRIGRLNKIAWSALKAKDPSEAERIRSLPWDQMSDLLETALRTSLNQ